MKEIREMIKGIKELVWVEEEFDNAKDFLNIVFTPETFNEIKKIADKMHSLEVILDNHGANFSIIQDIKDIQDNCIIATFKPKTLFKNELLDCANLTLKFDRSDNVLIKKPIKERKYLNEFLVKCCGEAKDGFYSIDNSCYDLDDFEQFFENSLNDRLEKEIRVFGKQKEIALLEKRIQDLKNQIDTLEEE